MQLEYLFLRSFTKCRRTENRAAGLYSQLTAAGLVLPKGRPIANCDWTGLQRQPQATSTKDPIIRWARQLSAFFLFPGLPQTHMHGYVSIEEEDLPNLQTGNAIARFSAGR